MADEIAQVCQIEIEGITMVFKGSVKVIAWLAQAIKAMMEHTSAKITEYKGEKDIKQIWKLSKDVPPQVIQIDNDRVEDILKAAEKAGLRWCSVPDLNSNDGKVPICIPPQDVALFSAIIQSRLEKDISESQKILNSYNGEISELKEKLLHAIPEERGNIRTRIENLEQARDELIDILDSKKSTLRDGCSISFQDYLAAGTGTEFEKDPDKAITELEKGVEIAPKLNAKECMQPIREKALMPDSAIRFYVPEMGVTVSRKFEIDNDVVYSSYSFKSDSGEIYEFTDKDITREEWNMTILPELLDKAGILENTECRIFESTESLTAYAKYYNNTIPKSEVRLMENDELVFSSAEAEREIRASLEDMLKGMASAKVDENNVYIKAPAESFIQQNGKLSVVMGTDLYELADAKIDEKQDGFWQIVVDKDSVVTLKSMDIPERQLSALSAQKSIHDARQSAIEAMVSSMKR